MSLEFLNDLTWWAVGSGGFALGIFESLFGGGGGGGSAPAFPTGDISKITKDGTNASVGMAWGSEAAKIAKALEDRKTWQSRGEGVNGEWYDPYRKKWVPEKEYRKQIKDLNRSLEKVAEPLVPGVAKLGDKLIKNVDKLVADGKKELNQEEKELLGRLQRHEQKLNKFQKTQDASLLADIDKLNDDLERGMNLLNAEDKAAFESELTSFKADAAKLTQDYDTRATGETERGFAEGQKAISDYEAQRLADVDASKKEEFSETSRFKGKSDSLAEQYRKEGEALQNIYRADSTAEADRREQEGKGVTNRFDSETKSLTSQYKQDTSALADKYSADKENLTDEFMAMSNQSTRDFESKTGAAAEGLKRDAAGITDQYRADTESLGDTFLSMVGTSTADYNQRLQEALDLSPERLNIFTQAADFLSQAAVQTRMNMLATADPRALELSAIADENAAAMMSGRISSDVQANLARSSAMRALGGGFGAGSQMGRGLAARDLGLTSLDLMRQGSALNESQRRLNYETRVAGTQADAAGLLANDQTTRRAGAADILTAETNRNATFFGERNRSFAAELDARNRAAEQYAEQLRLSATGVLGAETDRNRAFLDVGERGLANELTSRTTAALNYLDQNRLALTERQRSELDQLNKVGDARQNIFTNVFNAARGDAQGIYNNQLESARMAYSNNLGTMRTGAARRDNTFDTVLASNLTNIDTRTGRNLGISQDVFNAGMNTNQIGFTAEMGNLNNRTNRNAQTLRDTWNTSAQARTGVYNERLNNARSIYSTNTNAVGNMFTTNANFINSTLGTRANTLGNVYGQDVGARTLGFRSMYDAKMNEVATNADARQKQWAAENAAYTSNQNNKNAMWGNIIQAGATIAGAAVGTASGNPMAGIQIGSTLGSVGNQAVSGGSGGGSGGGNIFSSFGSLIGSLGQRSSTFQAPSGWNQSKGDWFNYSA